ncbi:MAG: DUF3999 domain-containing protein [Treponema sp.]|nr:DUF3999 domain-containing protein [Treponema sp.]
MKLILSLVLSFFAVHLFADTPVPKPEDFAGSITLEGEGGRLLKIEIPEAVYSGLLRPDRGDIRVFDVSGAIVPFTVLPAADRTGEKIIAGQLSPDRRSMEFNTEGFYPLVSINFLLGENDTIDVRVRNKYNAAYNWNSVDSITLYRLNSETEYTVNTPLAVRSSAPFWRIEARGEFSFSSPVECQIKWTVQDLIFFGRGGGPWTLAYGNSEFSPMEGLRLDEYPSGENSIFQTAVAGEPRYIPREEQIPETSRGQWFLWTILSLAVIILLTLALITAKSMSKNKSGE